MTERSETGSVGARLKLVRESKHVTLRQIANTTRIAVSALDAIERDDVKKLPGGIFARSFVRAYASELKLDVEQTVTDFFAQFPGADRRACGARDRSGSGRGRPSRVPAGIVRGGDAGHPDTRAGRAGWCLAVAAHAPREEPPLASERIPAVRPELPPPAPARAVA